MLVVGFWWLAKQRMSASEVLTANDQQLSTDDRFGG